MAVEGNHSADCEGVASLLFGCQRLSHARRQLRKVAKVISEGKLRMFAKKLKYDMHEQHHTLEGAFESWAAGMLSAGFLHELRIASSLSRKGINTN